MGRPKTLKQAMPGLWRIMRHFWPYTRKHRPLIAGSFLALFASVGFKALEPWPLKIVFDHIILPENAGDASGLPGIDSLDPAMLLTLAALALVIIIALRAVNTYFNAVGFALIGNRVLTDVRGDLFRHLHGLSLSFHNKARNGDLIVRVIGDIGRLKDVAVTAFMPLLASILVLFAMTLLMFWLHWKLALLVLATLPLYWLPTTRLSRRIQQVSRKQRKREGAMASTAAESMGAMQVVQTLSLEDTFSQTFSGQNKKSLKDGVKAKRLAARLQGTVQVMIAVSTALVIWYGTRLILTDALTPGELLVFLVYLKAASKPMGDFAKYTGRLAKASVAGERVLDLFDQTPEVIDHPDAVTAPALTGAVHFDKVYFAYEPGHPVLENVTLTVPPGQHIALVGPSGNGKSTLVSLISRLYDPDEGHVLVDGFDISTFTLASFRTQLSVVLQDNMLFAASVRENIGYGAPGVTPEEIETAARLANAHGFITALPEGYDTVIGERGVTLSAGQRQRIAIARAAVRKAPILILDEPTTGLDEENERAVIEALERLAEGRTTFLITHDLRFASRSDLIVYLEKGRIREWGTHKGLLRAGGRYAAMYRLESATPLSEIRMKDHHAIIHA